MAIRDNRDVLVVDDDDAVRRLLHRSLTQAGMSCDLAIDGEDALEQMRRNRYLVVLTDLMMPRVDGAELSRRVAARERAHRPVIMVITAFPASDRLPALDETIQAIVRKPFDAYELTGVVLGCVQAGRKARPPSQPAAVSA